MSNVVAMKSSVIVAGARTPIGRFNGALKSFSATDLGGLVIKAAIERAGISPSHVQYLIMGQALQAGAGKVPHARLQLKLAFL